MYARASEVHQRDGKFCLTCGLLGFYIVVFLVQSKDYEGLIYLENNGVYFKILERMKILIWAQPSSLLPCVKFNFYHRANKRRMQHHAPKKTVTEVKSRHCGHEGGLG